MPTKDDIKPGSPKHSSEEERAASSGGGEVSAPKLVDVKGKRSSKHKAICVGINNYGGVNTLPSCVQDAQSFANLLQTTYGFDEVEQILDSQAISQNVTNSLTKLFSGASSDDRLVFYFSGHGSTSLRNGVLEECIVLKDGFFFGDQLSELTQKLPPGILTVVLDSCFSGGMNKTLLMSVVQGFKVVDRVQVKAFTREETKALMEHADEQETATAVRRFGESVTSHQLVAGPITGFTLVGQKEDEHPRLLLNGLLLSACKENETAAASTPQTQGKSAFTFSLLECLNKLGVGSSTDELLQATGQRIRSLGLAQTPVIKEPPVPKQLGERAFVTLQNAKAETQQVPALGVTEPETAIRQLIEAVLRGVLSSTEDKATKETTNMIDLQQLLPWILTNLSTTQSSDNGQQKLFGIDDAILIPALISIAGSLVSKKSASTQQKLFGIDDAILIPALATLATSLISQKSAPQQQKLFGIDDAILIPAIAGVVTAAISKKSAATTAASQKSLLGSLVPLLPVLLAA